MKLAFTTTLGVLLLLAGTWTVWNSTLGTASCAYTPTPETTQTAPVERVRRPVLVELFTSEGCSSCPPADRQLAFMQEHQTSFGAKVITLAYHVDYWDRLGWKDRFSSAEFSERQNAYISAKGLESSYTPQMIVDGGEQFVGSNGRKADQAVADAAKNVKGVVGLSLGDGNLNVTIGDLPEHQSASIMLAVAEDRLETDVRAGENNGNKLSHTGVVRSLTTINKIEASDQKLERSIAVPADAGWNSKNVRYVVFVQEEKSKKIIAVDSTAAVN
ncbi:MAG: DUF1223 domain-containing protein [Pyrinomonadaceae bacterium]